MRIHVPCCLARSTFFPLPDLMPLHHFVQHSVSQHATHLLCFSTFRLALTRLHSSTGPSVYSCALSCSVQRAEHARNEVRGAGAAERRLVVSVGAHTRTVKAPERFAVTALLSS